MARIGIIVGLLLCGLTILGMSITMQKSYTQFVPMMFGIPMLFLGVVSLNPHRRFEAVGAAMLLTIVGALIGFVRTVYLTVELFTGGYVNPVSHRLVILMTVFCGGFILIAAIWRRRKTKPEPKKLNANLNSSTIVPHDDATPAPAKPNPSTDTNPYQTPSILD